MGKICVEFKEVGSDSLVVPSQYSVKGEVRPIVDLEYPELKMYSPSGQRMCILSDAKVTMSKQSNGYWQDISCSGHTEWKPTALRAA